MATMTQLIVATQVELDEAIAGSAPQITIRASRSVWLSVGDTRLSDVWVAGETRINECSGRVGRVTDIGRVSRVTGSGRVGWVGDSASVGRVTNSGSVGDVTDTGRVDWVTGSGRVGWVADSASVGRVTGSGRVGSVNGTGRIGDVTGSGRIDEVTGSGRVGRVAETASVGRVTDSGRVGWVTDTGRIDWVTDTGIVERAAGTSSVHLYGNAKLVKASAHVAVFLHSAQATAVGGHQVDLTDLDLHDPETWCEYYGVTTDHGQAVVYKAVRPDFRSAHGTSYRPGTTASCDDFEADNECGHGLHISPTPFQADTNDARATRYVEVRVDIHGLNIISADKAKAASVVVVREVDIHGQPVT